MSAASSPPPEPRPLRLFGGGDDSQPMRIAATRKNAATKLSLPRPPLATLTIKCLGPHSLEILDQTQYDNLPVDDRDHFGKIHGRYWVRMLPISLLEAATNRWQ